MNLRLTPDTITVLTTKGPLATKIISLPAGAAKPIIRPYDNARVFRIAEYPVGNIDDLAMVLNDVELCPTAFVVRGRPLDGIDRNNALRRAHPGRRTDGTVEPATLEAAARYWVPLDFDSVECPAWLDPGHEPDATVEHLTGLLPEEFHGATCRWSFTSGQGLMPGIRMRLFFWADRPLADWELKTWLGERLRKPNTPKQLWPTRYPVDPSLFAPAQPIYVARPQFRGMPDPVPIRSGIWRGDRDAITPPPISRPVYSPPPRPAGVLWRMSNGDAYQRSRERIGDHEGGVGFHDAIKSAIGTYIAMNGASAATAWLRDDLEQAIRTAPRDPEKHPDHYIEYRVRDLDTLIPAIVAMQAASEAKVEHCDPTYPAPMVSVAEARARLQQLVDEHVISVETYAAEMAAYRASLSQENEQ